MKSYNNRKRDKLKNAMHNRDVKPFYKRLDLWVAAAFCGLALITLISLNAGNYDDGPSEASLLEAVDMTNPIVCTDLELTAAYNENLVAADEQYKGKAVEITGDVHQFAQASGKRYVLLRSFDKWLAVYPACVFDNEEEMAKLEDLQQGDTVTVLGVCTGIKSQITIKNCTLVSLIKAS